ncbi:MAG TPA: DUF5009 domain-containing protein [Marinilabiliales bacterium]|nr:DUF5009 domain-containing protein [Marinilabiliales bacterium]HAZ01313.1 DUF5009 domain-containing protein [Marinilabiliales bacterium]HBO75498.1 DUF5009 domain-containing protein [Marinilabiliales bacterium]HBX83128.1 DUF5009 domain-containing protein [Marinilabiliales bacterium]HBY53836.1 DUF5009 domain-containing protein [Marinilabiliales bacterium]
MKNTTNFFKKMNEMHVSQNRLPSSGRVLSIDALRGFDMFWIIGGSDLLVSLNYAVNHQATGFLAKQMDHVEWLGFNFYDIIMPLFLFIVGVAMPFSFHQRLDKNPSVSHLWIHIIKRVAILWILGMVVQGNLLSYDFSKFKFYSNTLQAIAAGYLIASVVILHLKVTWQILSALLLVAGYWIVLSLVPVPGFGSGNITPEGNFAIYLDKLVFGAFQDGTTYTWILSSLTFGATTLLGVFTGYLLQSVLSNLRKLQYIAGIGIGMIVMAEIMNIWHPIVKHIWTGSFVFFSGGLCMILLAIFYGVVDFFKIQTRRKFFIIIGANAIFAYMASHLFDWGLIADVFIGGLKQYTGQWYDLLRNVGRFSVLYFILWQMYKRKIFIKI